MYFKFFAANAKNAVTPAVLLVANQIFHYTRCIMSKRVTSLRGPSLRHCARATQLHATFEEMLQQWPAVGRFELQISDLRFEFEISRSRDERVTARPTNRIIIVTNIVVAKILIFSLP